MSLPVTFFKLALGDDFEQAEKNHGLKIGTDVVPQEEQDGRRRAVSSATMSVADVIDPNGVQCLLHAVHLKRVFGFDLMVVANIVFLKDSIPIPYRYQFHCTPIDKVPERFLTCAHMVLSMTLTGRDSDW